jgi:hypothetical protein
MEVRMEHLWRIRRRRRRWMLGALPVEASSKADLQTRSQQVMNVYSSAALRRQEWFARTDPRGDVMTNNMAIEPGQLDDLAAIVGLSVKEANKVQVCTLLASTRESVMRRADALPVEAPPALFFDPR